MRRKITPLITSLLAILSLTACDPTDYVDVWPLRADDPSTTEVEPTLTDEQYVNLLPYDSGDYETAKEAWIVVARARGWGEADIVAWTPFVMDIIMKESTGCWNIRRGSKFLYQDGTGCFLKAQGKHSDSGIGQVLGGYPNRRGWYLPVNGGTWKLHENASWLCPQEGLCTPDDIVATAWNSYNALVATLERTWGEAWCYKQARGFHNCKLRP